MDIERINVFNSKNLINRRDPESLTRLKKIRKANSKNFEYTKKNLLTSLTHNFKDINNIKCRLSILIG